eukprot:SAG31_NODE_35548_length_322_cov_0.677130_2_plen_38_part_01
MTLALNELRTADEVLSKELTLSAFGAAISYAEEVERIE